MVKSTGKSQDSFLMHEKGTTLLLLSNDHQVNHENTMFTSTGILHYDPGQGQKHYEPWWALLVCDDEVARYYAWQLKKHGVEVYPNDKGLWGTHVSVLKGEAPLDPTTA